MFFSIVTLISFGSSYTVEQIIGDIVRYGLGKIFINHGQNMFKKIKGYFLRG